MDTSDRYRFEPSLRWNPQVEEYFIKAYGADHFARISKSLTLAWKGKRWLQQTRSSIGKMVVSYSTSPGQARGMDSQQHGYFTNLLQERPNIDEHYLMESQYLNQNTQVFAQESQFTAEIESSSKKPQRGGNFTIAEDKLLVSAWLNISLDAVHGNEQKRSTYWKKVWDFFHKHKKFESNRNENSLMNRWSTIQLAMNKFCGCYAQIESLHQSGINEDDKICKAKIMYKELKKSTFQFEHCWIIPRTGTTSSPCTPDSINLGEDDVSPNDFVDLQRPTGRKVEKERLNKRKNKESIHSSITKTLEDIKQDKKKMIDKKIEMIDKVYVQKEVELHIMQEKHEVELEKHEMELFKEDERVIFDGSQWLAGNPTRILSCSADGNH
ncbi:unnamed protein product [Camellia sinensis]